MEREEQYVSFLFLLKKSNLSHHMDRILNLLHVIDTSIWERAHSKCLKRESTCKTTLEVDFRNLLLIIFSYDQPDFLLPV